MHSYRPLIGLVATMALLQAAALGGASPPPNDDFDSVPVISALPYSTTIDTTQATRAVDDPLPCSVNPGPTVWFAFTSPVDTGIVFHTDGSDYQPIVSVWTGSRGSLVQPTVYCDTTARSAFTAAAGQTYFFMITDFAGQGGHLSFTIEQIPGGLPPNDDFDNATVITGLPFTDAIRTTEATSAVDDPGCALTTGATVWYAFTSPVDSLITFDTGSGDYGPDVSVWTGSRGALTEVVGCGQNHPFEVTAGQTYFIMVARTLPGQAGYVSISVKIAFTEVTVDIKPGDFPNSIQPTSNGVVPVAILSTPTFDATTIDPTSVTLASAPVRLRGQGMPMASLRDINGDGLPDLVVQVTTAALELSASDTEAVLKGRTFAGISVRGVDSVRVVR
jgi:hypothetical protein